MKKMLKFGREKMHKIKSLGSIRDAIKRNQSPRD
jgi:hypothetical protein